MRMRLKAADREVQRLAEQASDAERRANFAQEVLAEERRQAALERENLEKLIKALGGALEEPRARPARPEPPEPPAAPAAAEAPVQNGAAAPADVEAERQDDA